jgi:hypothetical protein
LSEQHAQDGVVVLAVNAWNEPKDEVHRFVKERRLKYRILLDGQDVFASYGFQSVPTVVFIGPDGMVASVEQGFMGAGPLERGFKALVGG